MKEIKNGASEAATKKPSLAARYGLDIGIVLVTCLLLFIGGSNWQLFTPGLGYFNPTSDMAKYQCYTVGFWNGTQTVKSTFTPKQCGFMNGKPVTNEQIAQFMEQHNFPRVLTDFVKSQPVDAAFHALPHEYPYLSLAFFSLALIAPPLYYQFAFALWAMLLFVVMYFVIKRFHSRGAAIAFALFLLTGASFTSLARFDLIPAAATLFAVICAARKRWHWAYIFLAIATLLKFYPGILLIPFFMAQQMELGKKLVWFSWRRWSGLFLFVVLCAVVMAGSLLLSVEGTVGQFAYFGQRPIQAESFGASLMWIVTSITHSPMSYGKTFGSLNILSHASLMSKVSLLENVLLAVGLLCTWWLQLRGKLDLAASSLLTLLVILVTGKIFSPQYLIWVAPLVAYVGGASIRWLISWGLVGVLTTIIYPFIYEMAPLPRVPLVPVFFPVVTLRNFVLFGFVLAIMVYYARKPRVVQSTNEQEEERALPEAALAHEVGN